jgi:Tol biopolymer transport system component
MHYDDLSLATKSNIAVASQLTRVSDIWVGEAAHPDSLRKVTPAIDEFAWSPADRIVYTSTVSGNRDLWTMAPDGREQRQITANTGDNGVPAVTDDNAYVAFVSNRTGLAQVWRMSADGANQLQLTRGAGKYYPSTSPDGRSVLYNTTDDWHLWRVSIDGGEPVGLTDYVAMRPAVSPDGKMIACVTRDEAKRELLIIPFEGGPPVKRFAINGRASRIQWAADNKSLFYAVEHEGAAAIVKQSLDGATPKEVVSFPQNDLFDFAFSPDGQMLAVTRGDWQDDIVLVSDLNH